MDTPAPADAATRFYERSHRINDAGPAEPLPADTLRRPGHRYSAAYRYLAANPGLTVAELGYGSDRIVPLVAAVAGELHIVDIVDRRSRRLPANVFTQVGNLDNDWPFADARFDAVLAMMVIEHLYDPFHAFAELARILRPGGRAFVNLPNIASLRCRLQLLAGRMPVTSAGDWFAKREWDGNHLHYFTVADVRRVAALNGLRVEALHPVGGGLALKALNPALFCHEITYALTKAGA
jgi:SAM-dependent methyltransferase